VSPPGHPVDIGQRYVFIQMRIDDTLCEGYVIWGLFGKVGKLKLILHSLPSSHDVCPPRASASSKQSVRIQENLAVWAVEHQISSLRRNSGYIHHLSSNHDPDSIAAYKSLDTPGEQMPSPRSLSAPLDSVSINKNGLQR
jgi:hypothetical protein